MQRLSSTLARRTYHQALSTSAGSQEHYAQIFEEIVTQRRAIKAFSETPLPADVLPKILKLAQLTPTATNVQPYAVIAVTDAKKRQQLSEAMLGGNKQKVATAPVTIVFAADLEPMRRVPALCDLETKGGKPKEIVASLPAMVSMFAGGGNVAKGFKKAFMHLTSPLVASPSVSTTQAWSYKNTTMVALAVMLAAQSHGISSCPMEGFDARRVRHAINLPDRYDIPIAVCLGYPAEGFTPWPRTRFDFDTVCFENNFGQTFGGEQAADENASSPETTPGTATSPKAALT